MWVWLALVVAALVLTAVAVALLLWRGRTQALALRPQPAGGPPVEDDDARLPGLVRELHPAFRTAVKRLRGLVRNVDFRYGVPWYLLVGPPDAGKTTLLADIPKAVPARLADDGTPQPSGISWHYVEGGVLIDVPGALAFPRGGRGLGGWRALLQLLTRYRPRRPIDGILVAVPASLLVDESWKSATHDLGAAIRERLLLAQNAFGFSLPVYVVLTQSDAVPGFAAFTDALPDGLHQDMIGWSNPHDLEVVFQGVWIDQAFEEIHRGLVHVQVEMFAAGEPGDQASALFLFPGELRRLAAPVRALLEEIFRPSVYHAGLVLRGFYFTGQGRVARDRAVSFLGDLLEHKVFPERGLAAPLDNTSVARTRVSRIAQATAALLLLVLGTGTYLEYRRLQNVQQAHAQFFADVESSLDLRLKHRNRERTLSDEERIGAGYNLLETVATLSEQPFASIFLPTFRLAPIVPGVERVLTATFSKVILPDFRLGLEHKGQQLFDWTGEARLDEPAADHASPALDTSPHYRALEAFAREYRAFVDNYFRYVGLSRTRSGDFKDLAELGNYVTGRAMLATVTVPQDPYGLALSQSTAVPVDCSSFDGRVEQRARRLLAEFGSLWFGDNNPVRTSERRLVELWKALTTTDDANLRDLVRELDRLTVAVNTWSRIGSRSGELRLPVLEQAPFTRLESGELCAPLKPDLSDAIRRTAAMRDALSDTLLMIEAPPFGPVLVRSDAGLQLGAGMHQFKAALDDLRMQPFRLALPTAESEPVLPLRPTWRQEELDRSVALFEAFDRYRGGAFATIDPAFRRPLLEAVTADMSQALAMRIAFDATEAPQLPGPATAMMADALRLGAVITRMERLIPFFENGDVGFAEEVTNTLSDQAANALRRLDQEASAELPHVFNRQVDTLFAAWTETQAEYTAAPDALKRWHGRIDEQRDAIRRYAAHADPLARFLARTSKASPVSAKWVAIADDVMNYDRKLPGNGLGALDAFLRDGFTAIVTDPNCAAAVAALRSAGFFGAVRNELVVDTRRQCRDVSRAGTERRYAAIAEAFNSSLAGRFPFSDGVAGVPEAAIADVVSFLRVHARNEGRTLGALLQTHACTDDAIAFTRHLDSVLAILAPMQEPPAPVLALDVTPEFRVNREREIGGNQIIHWQLDLGRETLADAVPAKPVRWAAGDPVRLAMRFAKDSPSRPVVRAGGVPAPDRVAQFDFRGSWALLALLRAGRSEPADLLGPDSGPNVLRFDIPVERDPAQPPVGGGAGPASPFRVYLRLRLAHAGKPDALTIRDFPVRAPAAAPCTPR